MAVVVTAVRWVSNNSGVLKLSNPAHVRACMDRSVTRFGFADLQVKCSQHCREYGHAKIQWDAANEPLKFYNPASGGCKSLSLPSLCHADLYTVDPSTYGQGSGYGGCNNMSLHPTPLTCYAGGYGGSFGQSARKCFAFIGRSELMKSSTTAGKSIPGSFRPD